MSADFAAPYCAVPHKLFRPTRNRRHVDDGPAAPTLHVRRHKLRQPHPVQKRDVEGPMPVLVRRVENRRPTRGPAHVVHQHVDAPKAPRRRHPRTALHLPHLSRPQQPSQTRAPIPRNSFSTARNFSSSRPQIPRWHPSWANSRAVASPMPRVPPVTSATLPSSCKSISRSSPQTLPSPAPASKAPTAGQSLSMPSPLPPSTIALCPASDPA